MTEQLFPVAHGLLQHMIPRNRGYCALHSLFLDRYTAGYGPCLRLRWSNRHICGRALGDIEAGAALSLKTACFGDVPAGRSPGPVGQSWWLSGHTFDIGGQSGGVETRRDMELVDGRYGGGSERTAGPVSGITDVCCSGISEDKMF